MESLDGGFVSPAVSATVGAAAEEAELHIRSPLTSPLTMAYDPNLIQASDANVVLFNDMVGVVSTVTGCRCLKTCVINLIRLSLYECFQCIKGKNISSLYFGNVDSLQ